MGTFVIAVQKEGKWIWLWGQPSFSLCLDSKPESRQMTSEESIIFITFCPSFQMFHTAGFSSITSLFISLSLPLCFIMAAVVCHKFTNIKKQCFSFYKVTSLYPYLLFETALSKELVPGPWCSHTVSGLLSGPWGTLPTRPGGMFLCLLLGFEKPPPIRYMHHTALFILECGFVSLLYIFCLFFKVMGIVYSRFTKYSNPLIFCSLYCTKDLI